MATTTTPLRQRMIDDMKVRNMSPLTQRAYVRSVKNFSAFFGRSPDTLTFEDVRTYRLHLISLGKKPQTINQIVCALRFFYAVTLRKPEAKTELPLARRADILPAVLAPEEVARFLGAIANVKHRAAFATVYAAGLRVSEVAALKVGDIDSQRMVIHVDKARAARTALSCCRSSSSAFCAPIGGPSDRRSGSSPASIPSGRSRRVHCNSPAAPRLRSPSWTRRSRSTPCDTASPPICSNVVSTSG